MSFIHHPPYQIRMKPGLLHYQKERCMDLFFFQYIQQPAGVRRIGSVVKGQGHTFPADRQRRTRILLLHPCLKPGRRRTLRHLFNRSGRGSNSFSIKIRQDVYRGAIQIAGWIHRCSQSSGTCQQAEDRKDRCRLPAQRSQSPGQQQQQCGQIKGTHKIQYTHKITFETAGQVTARHSVTV